MQHFDPLFDHPFINTLITLALQEDIGSGDHSSLACVPSDARGKARLLVKDNGIICGLPLAQKVFHQVDPTIEVNCMIKDGDAIQYGDIPMTVEGPSRSLLTAERLILNFMQRLSGVATQTNELVKLIAHTKARLLDTRKTTPGMRILEKYAVKTGGGQNHRMGLYDMIMIKDNHIDFAGGIAQAIKKTWEYLQTNQLDLKIEIEARDIDAVKQILDFGSVDFIMLDNFTPSQIKDALQLIGGRYQTEASGGINANNLVEYAETGVDFISIGAITHQIKSLDLSLKAF
ncbi:MAG: carboxylating nicotinate-nucleotide diphosphorylase [Flavobacteriales bacterium]